MSLSSVAVGRDEADFDCPFSFRAIFSHLERIGGPSEAGNAEQFNTCLFPGFCLLCDLCASLMTRRGRCRQSVYDLRLVRVDGLIARPCHVWDLFFYFIFTVF